MPLFKFSLPKYALALGLAIAALPFASKPAQAQSEPFIGQLMLFGGNFCPRNWAQASGQLLPISQNTALFSLLGTAYGGDGRTTFGLPDLRGRTPIGVGRGPGLPDYIWGERGGATQFTLTVNQMPSHNHMINVVTEGGNKGGPGNDYLAIVAPMPLDNSVQKYSAYHDGPPNKQMDPGAISHSGGSQPVSHRSPYLAMYWCIALYGIYPSRS